MKKNLNAKPLVVKTDSEVIISFNGRKLIKPLCQYKDLSEEEIANSFVKGGENQDGQ